MKSSKAGFFYRNGLSIVLLVLMILSLFGQYYEGWNVKNSELRENHLPAIQFLDYWHNGHFVQALFENWESEFLQMSLYVLLTVFLRQKGSAESKKLFEKEEVDREPRIHAKAPLPVKKGGIFLKIYSHSLSISLGILFLFSFIMHFYGSITEYNELLSEKNLSAVNWTEYITESRFWFESFQNWQSEFLSVASIVILSIWLREKGSPESKPVDAPYDETA